MREERSVGWVLKSDANERAVLWRDAMGADATVRGVRLRALVRASRDLIAAPLSLYDSTLDEHLLESFELIDGAGFLGHDEFRHAFEGLDDDEPTSRAFVHQMQRELDALLDTPRDAAVHDRAAALSDWWRALLADSLGAARRERYIPVTDVAAAFDVTPAAVYKWIKLGRIEVEEKPSGGYLVPAEQFDDAQFERMERARRLRRDLKVDRATPRRTSREETVEVMKQRRRGR